MLNRNKERKRKEQVKTKRGSRRVCHWPHEPLFFEGRAPRSALPFAPATHISSLDSSTLVYFSSNSANVLVATPPCMSLGGQNDRRQQPSSPSTGSSPPPHPIPPTPSSTTPVFFCEGTKSTPQRSSYSTGSRPRAPPITTSSNAPPLPSTRMPPSPLSPLPTYSPDGSRMESNGNYAKVRVGPCQC